MSFLTRTYPFKQSKHLLKDSSIFGFIIWVILYFLQPFGLREFNKQVQNYEMFL